MHGGDCNAVAHSVRDVQVHDTGIDLGDFFDTGFFFCLAVLHSVQKKLNIGLKYPFQIVTDTHVENESALTRFPPSEMVLEHVQEYPGIQVLFIGLVEFK